MNRDNLRKVKYTKFPDGSGAHEHNAYFHRFGDFPYPTDDGRDFGVTKAIVEQEDGKVIVIDVKRLKFVEDF